MPHRHHVFVPLTWPYAPECPRIDFLAKHGSIPVPNGQKQPDFAVQAVPATGEGSERLRDYAMQHSEKVRHES